MRKIPEVPVSSKRCFPSERQRRAVELGADELLPHLEWAFRNRPRALRNIRHRHRLYSASLLQILDRSETVTRMRRAA
jgi:hypothetical protein